ncbi:MAG: alcohol dehydrogenase catalytic domain-containing protein [Chloroflexi bacterium]|nr:alcohol dehydrogenase catalytic domain-containing protein [Chloroflexota bacterium]
MLAVQYNSRAHRARLAEVREPRIETPTQVKIKVQQIGVCGVDANILQGLEGVPPHNAKEIVVGHEVVGRVVEVGPAVEQVGLGDVVATSTRRGCRICENCLRGEADLCSSGLYVERGIREAHGFLAECFVEEAEHLVLVPPDVEPVAALLEPASLVVKSMELVRGIEKRVSPWCGHFFHAWDQPDWAQHKRVMVTGGGDLALLAAAMFRACGSTVLLYSPYGGASLQAALAQELQVEWISSTQHNARLPDRWADVLVDTTGEMWAAHYVRNAMARNSVAAIVTPSVPSGDFQAEGAPLLTELLHYNQVLVGCSRANLRHLREAEHALARLSSVFPGLLPRFLTHRFPMQEYAKAAAVVGPDVLKSVVTLEQ